MKFFLFIVLSISLSVGLTSCDDGLIREPTCVFPATGSITRLVEIVNLQPIDRTSEIEDCKENSLFRFNLSVDKMNIVNQLCNSENQEIIASASRGILDSAGTELLRLELTEPFILHDSLTIGQSDLSLEQFYEIVRIDNEILIIQTHNELSVPKTINTWQLTLSF